MMERFTQKLMITITILFLYNCKDYHEIKKYDENGNLISSYFVSKKDTLKKIEFINDELTVKLSINHFKIGDTIYETFKNGSVFMKILPINRDEIYFEKFDINKKINLSGYFKNNNKNRIWIFYNDNVIVKKNYYVEFMGSISLSEMLVYKEGKLDENKSDFLNWSLPDTLMKGKNVGDIKFKRKWKLADQTHVIVSTKIEKNFKNLTNVKLDTFPFPNDKKNLKVL